MSNSVECAVSAHKIMARARSMADLLHDLVIFMDLVIFGVFRATRALQKTVSSANSSFLRP